MNGEKSSNNSQRKIFRAAGTSAFHPPHAIPKTAKKWFERVGNDLDGIVAKKLDADYRSGERDGMEKIKLNRTADCVIGGFRYAAKAKVIGSLLLGLYDDAGLLNHVGFCSGLKADERKALVPKLNRLDQTTRLHRPRPRRPQPLEHQTLHGMGTTHAQARRRSQL